MTEYCLRLSIAGIAIIFRMQSKRMHQAVLRRYRAYERNSKKPALIINCTFSRKPASGNNRLSVRKNRDGRWHIKRKDFECTMLSQRAGARLYPSIFAFDGLLRIALSIRALEKHMVLMHAAGLALKSNAFIFPGVSSAGKTTISKCANKAGVLNDEIICIDASKEDIKIHATPFWGEMGTGPYCARSYPLRCILFPRKSRTAAHTKQISSSAALPELLRCCCVFGNDAALCARALTICMRLTTEVSMRQLYFPKATDIDAVLQSILGVRHEA